MGKRRTTGTDKNIVDRRNNYPRSNSVRAVKDIRHRLNSFQNVVPGFERELLQAFAENHIRAIYLFPAIIVTAGVLASRWLGIYMAVSWAGMMMLVYGVHLAICRQLLEAEFNEIIVRIWRRRVYFSSALVGLGWAVLFVTVFSSAPLLGNQIMQFVILLCMMTLAAMSSYPIKYAGSITTAPSVLLLAIYFAILSEPASLVMSGILIIAQAFFSVLGEKLQFGSFNNLKNRAERNQLIAELATASAISEEARRRAEEANLAKSRFLATMSHELRTPLNAILGFSEVMKNGVLGPLENKLYREYVTDIHSSGTHLLNLINEILDLSRIEAGRYNLTEEAINLDYVVAECEQLIKLKAKNKNITIERQIAPGLTQIWADERSIRQVILNLLSNALKFTPSGGLIQIMIGMTSDGGQFVTIRDNGPGIAEEEIPVVLSSFGQGSIAIKSAEQGTGLGLPIVQALMDKHDGTFELKSKLREGTEVTITIPSVRVLEVMPPIEQNAPPLTSPEPKKRGSFFKGLKSSA